MNRILDMEFDGKPEGGRNNSEMEMEMELADKIYVFYDKDKPGFMFYDQTPTEGSIEGRLLGVPPKGVYYARDIEEARWNDEINKPNETVLERYVDGSNEVTTIMVSEEEMKRILEQIEEEKKKESSDGKIRIDLRQRQKVDINRLTQKSIKDVSNLDEEIKKMGNLDNLNKINNKEIDIDNKENPEDYNF